MGYTESYLLGIVVVLATIMVMISYVPAVLMSILIYGLIRRITSLAAEMTIPRLIGVLSIAWTMSMACALLSLRALRKADPAADPPLNCRDSGFVQSRSAQNLPK